MLVLGGLLVTNEARGPRLVTVGDSSQKIYLLAHPTHPAIVAKVEQGASCEVVESVLVGGSRWYHVRTHGGEGWTQLVDE